MMADQSDVDVVIRARDLTKAAFDQVSQALKELEKQTEQSQKPASGFRGMLDGLKGGVGGLIGSLGPLGPAIAGAFTLGAITSAIQQVGDFAGEITDLSSRLSWTAEQVQKVKFAAEQSGSSINSVTTSVSMLSRTLVDGNEGAIQALGQLGLNLGQIRSMNSHEAFVMIGEAIGKVPDPMLQTALAMELLGKSGGELIPMFKNDLPGAMDRATVMSNGMIEGGDRLGDEWDRMMLAGKGLLASVIIPLAPALTVLADVATLAAGAALSVGEALLWVTDHTIGYIGVLTGGLITGLKDSYNWFMKNANALAGDGGMTASLKQAEIGIKDMYKGSELKVLHMDLKEADAISEKLTEGIKRTNEEIKKLGQLRDQAFGTDKIKQAQQMVKAIGGLEGVSKMSAAQVGNLKTLLNEAMDASVKNGKRIPEDWFKIWEATIFAKDGTMEFLAAQKQVAVEIPKIGTLLQNTSTLYKDFGSALNFARPEDMTEVGQKVAPKFLEGFGDIIREGLGPAILGAVQGGGNVGGSIGGMLAGSLFGKDGLGKTISSGLSGALGSTLGGALGSIVPGLGTMLGSLGGKAIGSLVGKLFGGEGKKVNDLRDAFVDAAGGITELDRKAQAAGKTLDQLLRAKKVKDFEAAVKDLNGAFDEQAAKEERTQAAIEKYGFTIEELGPKMRNQRLSEMASDLLQEWLDLNDAQVNNIAINSRMGEAVSEYIQTAVRAGVEIDAAMRPMLESMAEQGTLLDENGNQIKDLTAYGVTFSQTLTQNFDRLIDAIKEMGNGVAGIGRDLRGIPTDVYTTIHVSRVDSDGTGGDVDVVSAAHGAYGDYGSGTRAVLHGREVVMPLDRPAHLPSSVLAEVAAVAGRQSGGGGGGITQYFVTDISGTREVMQDEFRRFEGKLTNGGVRVNRRVVSRR